VRRRLCNDIKIRVGMAAASKLLNGGSNGTLERLLAVAEARDDDFRIHAAFSDLYVEEYLDHRAAARL
jgi:hypothetical protein